MPSGYNRRDEQPNQSGDYSRRVFVYQPAVGVDSFGGVLRDPAGVGSPFGGAKPPDDQFLWQDRVSEDQYGLQSRTSSAAPVEEIYFTIYSRYARGKQYAAGMFIYWPETGASATVGAVKRVRGKASRFELNCRRVS